MENKRSRPGGRKQSENDGEKHSSKTSQRSTKLSGTEPGRKEKPYRKSGSSESRREKAPQTGKKKYTENKSSSRSGYGRERDYSSERRKTSEHGEEKRPFRKSKTEESAEYQHTGYGKDRGYSSERRKTSERGEEKRPFRKTKPTRSEKFRATDSENEHTFGAEKKRSFTRDDHKTRDHNFKGKPRYSDEKPPTRKPRPVKADPNAPIRLNKFIANAGVCSRREADKLIETGAVKVNGVIVTELGVRVSPADKVQLGDQTLSSEKLRYVLLNKPKGYITTSNDPFKRNTVMHLVEDACRERIYPVGRLDRNTTGLLLFTNDGELTKRLTHPRFGVRKVYDVELDKPLSKKDMESITGGVELDDDTILIDDIAYVDYDNSRKHIGIELHSGQNHVVRRIFEKFGYEVLKLDRVMIGSLTKKDLQRGRWRHLKDEEVRMLKRL